MNPVLIRAEPISKLTNYSIYRSFKKDTSDFRYGGGGGVWKVGLVIGAEIITQLN